MAQDTVTPHIKGDQSLALLREGYGFISSRCDRLDSDIFTTRLMLSPVTCVRGAAAAEMFYGADRFTRVGAMPPTVLRLLQDKGSVQQLDDSAHRHRKAMFVSLLMSKAAEAALLDIFRAEWREAVNSWSTRGSIVLFDEAGLVLTRTICRWAGVPLYAKSDTSLAAELASMVENSGRVSPAVLAALLRRRKSERFIERLVQDLREGHGDVSPSSPFAMVANYRDEDGMLLDPRVAAVEILNILRPTVAIARYIVFAALALHDHPAWRPALRGAPDERYECFAEEVRRLYPFFPMIGGKVRAPFAWDGHSFCAGDWVLLDLHGTDHDERRFCQPDSFDPHRDISWRDQGYDFVPHGGGPVRESHRCPGEQFTVAVLREATRLMVEEMAYEVPEQDLSIDLRVMPAKPASGMILGDISRRAS